MPTDSPRKSHASRLWQHLPKRGVVLQIVSVEIWVKQCVSYRFNCVLFVLLTLSPGAVWRHEAISHWRHIPVGPDTPCASPSDTVSRRFMTVGRSISATNTRHKLAVASIPTMHCDTHRRHGSLHQYRRPPHPLCAIPLHLVPVSCKTTVRWSTRSVLYPQATVDCWVSEKIPKSIRKVDYWITSVMFPANLLSSWYDF